MEHRWGARARIDTPVMVHCGSTLVLGVLRDASVSGAFLCTAAQLDLLARVHVTMSSPQLNSDAHIAAHVVRRCPEGFGLEWLELAPAEIVALLDPREAQRTIGSRTGTSTSLSLNQSEHTGGREVAVSSSSTCSGASDSSNERRLSSG